MARRAPSSQAASAPSPGARLALAIGSLIFLHAAYSAYEFVSVQKSLGLLSGAAARGLPYDIKAELFCGVVGVLVGLVLTASPLRDITWASEYRKRSIDRVDARPSFVTLNHRGPYLFGGDE